MKIELDLTKDELVVLQYVVNDADSPYAPDPLKDIYEVGHDDKPKDPYAALRSMADKLNKAVAAAYCDAASQPVAALGCDS